MAEQVQQERRGGSHLRPGPPARSRVAAPDGTPAVPVHRAPSGSRHLGTRTRPSGRSRTRTVGLVLVAAVLTTAAAFWLQDLREPSPARQDARPVATSLPGAGAPLSGQSDPQAGTGTGTASSPEPSTGLTPGSGAQASSDPGTGDPNTGGLAVADRTALVQAATGPTRDAASTRAALEQVLSDRANATTALLRAVVNGDLDSAVPAASAVDGTSADLEAVVAAWRDPETATQLRAAFDAQTVASRSYASAVRADDEPAADAARAEMGATSRVLGQTLEALTGGGITRFVPPEDAARLRDLVDAQVVGDTGSVDDIVGWLTARSGREGVALAAGLAGPA